MNITVICLRNFYFKKSKGNSYLFEQMLKIKDHFQIGLWFYLLSLGHSTPYHIDEC